MSHLFAFNNATETDLSTPITGSYDAEQQLWVAEDASCALGTRQASVRVTFGRNPDGEADVTFDF